MISYEAVIHPRAHVDTSVTIGPGTRVWQMASVTRGTVLGSDCVVWPFALLDGAVFGDRCKIASGVAMGPGFLVGDDVFIAPSVTFANDAWPEASPEGFEEGMLRSGNWAVVVGDGACIGANAVVLPGVRIGVGSIVAAGAVVSDHVPDGCLWRRDGSLMAVPETRRGRRMRFVEPSLYEVAVAEGTAGL